MACARRVLRVAALLCSSHLATGLKTARQNDEPKRGFLSVAEVAVGDRAEAWRHAGLHVEEDGTCVIGSTVFHIQACKYNCGRKQHPGFRSLVIEDARPKTAKTEQVEELDAQAHDESSDSRTGTRSGQLSGYTVVARPVGAERAGRQEIPQPSKMHPSGAIGIMKFLLLQPGGIEAFKSKLVPTVLPEPEEDTVYYGKDFEFLEVVPMNEDQTIGADEPHFEMLWIVVKDLDEAIKSVDKGRVFESMYGQRRMALVDTQATGGHVGLTYIEEGNEGSPARK